jgi:hypothetical protein
MPTLSKKECFYSLSYLFHTSFVTNSKQIRDKYITNSNCYEFVMYLSRICFEFVTKEV